MTQRLEEVLNLPSSQDIVQDEETVTKKTLTAQRAKKMAEFDQIASSLPHAVGLGTAADNDLDDIADRAMNAYDDLMRLGMNMEARFAGRIFEVAAIMLKNAIDARQTKINKKLKVVELQLRKEKQDQDIVPGDGTIKVPGEGFVVTDRNSLLAKIRTMT